MYKDESTKNLYISNSLASRLKKFTFYVIGESRYFDPNGSQLPGRDVGMYWSSVESWPSTKNLNLYLKKGTTKQNNGLGFQKPTGTTNNSLSYQFEPSKPVPTVGGNNLFLSCGPMDQSSVEHREDVLIFTTPTLNSDTAILGKMELEVYFSSDRNDTDLTIKVSDVYQNVSTLVSDNMLRMRWKDSMSKRTYLVKNKIYKISIHTWQMCYIFGKGHKIRLAISSSNYPRFSANFNNGNLVFQKGKQLIATNSIFFDSETYPSKLILPIVDLKDLPNNVL